MPSTTNFNNQGGTAHISGSVIGGEGNVVGAPASPATDASAAPRVHAVGDAAQMLQAIRALLDMGQLPEDVRDDVATAVAKAEDALWQDSPNLRRALIQLESASLTVQGIPGCGLAIGELLRMATEQLEGR